MTVSQKAALSLLISVFLFAGIAVLAYTGLFDIIETRFYNPSVTRSLTRETNRSAEVVQDFLTGLQTRFTNSLNMPSVRRSFLPNQSADDIFERSRVYGMFLEQIGGLQSVRFVDYNGVRIHFSTYAQDILSQDRLSAAYRNYTDDPQNEPFRDVQVPAQESPKLFLDNTHDRIIFSYPFYDSMDVYRGTALFTVSVRAVANQLISEGRIKVGEDVSVISTPPGILTGSPGTSKTEIFDRVSAIWNDSLLALTPFDSAGSDNSLAVISAKTQQNIFYGYIVNEAIFSFPQPMKVILLISIFLTIYLTIFFFFNLRQDTITVVQNRLKGLQISLIEQFYDRKGDMDWTHWTRELEQRREEIRAEVKRGIRTGHGRRSDENIDSLIDKSWDELLAVIGANRKTESGLDEEKLQGILNRILRTLPAASATGAVVPAAQPQTGVPAAPAPQAFSVVPAEDAATETEVEEAAEELETLEELDDAEELADAGAVDVDEAGEPAELEELTELEDLSEEISPDEDQKSGGLLAVAVQKQDTSPADEVVEDIEDISEGLADELDEIEELEELEEIDDAEMPGESNIAEPAAGQPLSAEQKIADLASQIEFSTVPADDTEQTEDLLDTELEIVSPFTSMLSSLDNVGIEDAEVSGTSEVPEASEADSETAADAEKDDTKKKSAENNLIENSVDQDSSEKDSI